MNDTTTAANKKLSKWLDGGLEQQIARQEWLLAEYVERSNERINADKERLVKERNELPSQLEWARSWIAKYEADTESYLLGDSKDVTELSKSARLVVGHLWPKEGGDDYIKLAGVYVYESWIDVAYNPVTGEELGMRKFRLETVVVAPPNDKLLPDYINSNYGEGQIMCAFPVEGRDPDDDRECFDMQAYLSFVD
jgi:hypothetical protein